MSFRADHTHQANIPYQTPRPFVQCNNCGRNGHPSSKCYAPGGGLEGQAPWKMSQGQFTQIPTPFPNHSIPSQAVNQHTVPSVSPMPTTPVQPAEQSRNIIMVVTVHEPPPEVPPKALISAHTSTFGSNETDTHTWLIDSAASSHLSGKEELFTSLQNISPMTIVRELCSLVGDLY